MEDINFRIKRIKIHNFKNFKDLDLELNKFNVVIGPNASGKTNFKYIFSFLKDIIAYGIDNAISYQGGGKYVRGISSKDKTLKMEFQFTSDVSTEVYRLHPRGDYGNIVTTNDIIYRFRLDFKENLSYKIVEDKLEIFCSFDLASEKHQKKYHGKIIISKHDKEIKIKYDFPPEAGSIIQRQYEIFEFSPLTKKQLLIESKALGFLVVMWSKFLSNMGIYDFEAKQLKSPSTMRSKVELAHDGSNLSYVFNNLRGKHEKRKIFENLMNDLLPFFKSITIERTSDGSLRFNLKESYNSKNIPAMFVSDGTVNMMALIMCLFLQENQFTLIEEPERNIHPGLLSKIIPLMEQVSSKNQIIITTHNLTILENVELENILLISRTKDGGSSIIKPQNHKIVDKFIDIMSFKEIMKQNLLR